MPLKVPPVNAILTEISGEGLDEDGYPTGPVLRFTGSVPAFVTERLQNVPVDGGTTLVSTITIAIPSALDVRPGDQLVYTRNGVDHTRVVDGAEDRTDAMFTRCFIRDAG